MTWFIRVATVVIISCAFAFLLSRIPAIQMQTKAGVVPFEYSVFQQQKKGVLAEKNIVDSLIQLALDLKIAKVDLTQTMLSIDLVVKDPRMDEPFVYSNLYDIALFSFRRTSNIDQVFVRVMQRSAARDGQEKDVLLLAMDARRENVPASILKADDSGMLTAEPFIRSHFRMTETERWRSLQKD